jgi:vacuolar protein sorting-associated protein 72
MPQKGVRIPGVKVCPVTRLPAKYFDPVTKLPYANLQAFKIIREAYYQQLETKGDIFRE